MWVCAWADAETCVVVAGAADAPAAAIPGAALNGISAGEQWSVIADGLELTATSQGETADLAAFDGFDQLCEVTGTVRLGGVEHPIVALGRRGLRAGSISRGSTRSVTSAPGSLPMTASHSPRRGRAAPRVTTAT